MGKLFEGLEQIEAVREHLSGDSFMSGLFLGHANFELLLPPDEPPEEKAEGLAYCEKIEVFLKAHVDPDEIERTSKIPQHVLQGLLDLGAFGMKIPKKYGGLGFSHTNYGRVLTVIASWNNILSLTVAVPQSIGIGMPILLYGNEAQKDKYLPLVARKEITAFALTEPETGSDAANVQTEAVIDSDGENFIISGEKLWCTNSPIARYLTLIARVLARKQIDAHGDTAWHPTHAGAPFDACIHTAFILDMQTPGVTVKQRCQFEGCRGIENGHLTFEAVKIPKENVIGELGKGLKYALSILNLGRAISVPAICLGMAKQAWQPTLDRANTRITFGQSLGTRQTQQIRVGEMATNLFAMEAMCERVWQMADHKNYDLRIEAAITKIFCSEQSLQFLNDAQVIFGGAGYETADSKRFRGQPAFGMEQLVRDATMYRIGEGATDILRPYVAREGLNHHLEQIKPLFDENSNFAQRRKHIFKLLRNYPGWYLSQWLPRGIPENPAFSTVRVRKNLTYIERTSRKLARHIFYAMLICRESMRDDQGRQNRIEQIGEELFTIAMVTLHADSINRPYAHELCDEFVRGSRQRIRYLLKALLYNDDAARAKIGKKGIEGNYHNLSGGIIKRGLDDYPKTPYKVD